MDINPRDVNLQQIHADPAWHALTEAVQRYAAAGQGHMTLDDDGSRYWVMDSESAHDAQAIADVLTVRADMVTHFQARWIDVAIQEAAFDHGLYDSYDQGTDVDGLSFYEPHGNPMEALSHAMKTQDAERQYADSSIADLEAAIESRNEQIGYEYLGDNFTTVQRIRDEISIIEKVLEGKRDQGQPSGPHRAASAPSRAPHPATAAARSLTPDRTATPAGDRPATASAPHVGPPDAVRRDTAHRPPGR